jgi:DNA-binding MarR family transcriptional regulator
MLRNELSDADEKRTVTLSRKDILAARRLLHKLLRIEATTADDLKHAPSAGQPKRADRPVLIARAQREFHDRRRRVAAFGQSMFGEAAWDMLLALYIVETSGQRQTVGSLMQFSGTPMTTAKRWLDFLAAHELVEREPHPTDRRTAFVRLTQKAREKLDMYYSETIETAM